MSESNMQKMQITYTPTTEEVRNQYSGFSTSNSNHTGQVYLNFAEFDRWLAEHDRQIAERVWEEGVAARERYDYPENPHRKGEEQ